jgi:hypothetical protein
MPKKEKSMKNTSFSLLIRRPTWIGGICAFRLFCVASVVVSLCSGLGLAQDAPAANVTGNGTADFIPRWTGPHSIGNSLIFQTVGGQVGIGTTGPSAKLDVKGSFTIHGTGFSIDPTGNVHFVSGQTFPGAGTVTSVGTGLGLTGGPITTSGTVSIDTGVVPQLGANNSFTGSEGIAGSLSVGGSGSFGGALGVSGVGNFSSQVAINAGNSFGVASSNNSSTQTLSLQNHAAASNSDFIEAQFDLNGKAVFFTDTLGDTTATGIKHAAVPMQNGQMVNVASMESPGVWFEDFGSGQLTGGITTVSIDASFSQIVSLPAGYHVFITPKGDCKGLFVTNETANGFEVRELSGGQSSVEFDYRIVAHRKGYEKVRLPLAKMPKPQRHTSSNSR